MANYPSSTVLAEMIRMAFLMEGSEKERLSIDLSHLPCDDRRELFRRVGVYCTSACLKDPHPRTEDQRIIEDFELGKDSEDLKVMASVKNIILGKEKYLKKPWNDRKLANILDDFFWHFKQRRLDQEMFALLDRTFDMGLEISKKNLSELHNALAAIIAELLMTNARIPFFPLSKTKLALRKWITERSKTQYGFVELSRMPFENDVREDNKLQAGYIPFYEALYQLWHNDRYPIAEMLPERIRFKAIYIEGNPYIDYDPDDKSLTIQEEIFDIGRSKAQQNLLRILFSDRKNLDREWQLAEIAIKENRNAKYYYDAGYQLRLKLKKKKRDDFLNLTTSSIRISKRYLN